MKCRHCRDDYEPFKCDMCKKPILFQCRECHMELVHDEVPDVTFGKPGVDDPSLKSEEQYEGDTLNGMGYRMKRTE